MTLPNLSIVLPAFNEGHRLSQNIALLVKTLDHLNIPYEVIIVNDGSTDNTFAEASRLANNKVFVLSYEKNRGKGYAVRQGMLKCKGQYHLFMDVDLATDLKTIEEFYYFMQKNPVDVLIGDRKSDLNSQRIKQPYLRRMLGKGFTCLSQILLNCPFHDFTCGFKMFTSQASGRIFSCQRIERWSFDSEILFIARKMGLRVREMPVIWRHQGNSKVRLFKDIATSLKGLVRIKLNDLKGVYK